MTMLAAQFSPGPDMLLLLKNAVNHPLHAGLMTVAGISAGLCVHCAVALLGLAAVFKAHPAAFRILTWGGAAYLAWIALRLLWSLRSRAASPAAEGETGFDAPLTAAGAFLQGFLTNITNAKAFLFLSAFMAAGMEGGGTERKWMLAGIVVIQALVFWSLFVRLLKHPGIQRLYRRAEWGLNAVFGILLLALAVRVALGD
ncbi:MAG: LysE family transporter [Verrucomicrobiales bacterium]|nr:LysE family transporter [Verrucomicrobiales bacterium]